MPATDYDWKMGIVAFHVEAISFRYKIFFWQILFQAGFELGSFCSGQYEWPREVSLDYWDQYSLPTSIILISEWGLVLPTKNKYQENEDKLCVFRETNKFSILVLELWKAPLIIYIFLQETDEIPNDFMILGLWSNCGSCLTSRYFMPGQWTRITSSCHTKL